jgi:hypothetical protein
MREAFLLVAVILFVIDGVMWWVPNAPYTGRLQSIGLAFFAASFLGLLPG